MIDVIWWNASRGNWDHGLICQTFDKHPELFNQLNVEIGDGYEGYLALPSRRAIVVVTGKPTIPQLRKFLDTMVSGVVILTSDEDAYFDYRAAVPSNLEVWTQYYTADRPDIKGRILLGAPNRLKNYKINKTKDKKYLWSFVGQVQNPFRQQCVDALKKLDGGFLQIAELFGGLGNNGMEYQEYLDIMCQSKYVICPSGSMSVDSFRLYEAMECGAIPITDARSPRDSKDFHFWNEVYPQHKLITVNFWEETTLKEILTFPNSNAWWFTYKKELEQKLIDFANA